MPRPYPSEFRDDFVRVARNRDDGLTIEQIATDFGVQPMTLTKWMRQADIDEPPSQAAAAASSGSCEKRDDGSSCSSRKTRSCAERRPTCRRPTCRAFSEGRISGYRVDPDIGHPAHVHAAAVHADIDFVITADRDFSQWAELFDSLSYEVHSPDSFFCLLDDSSPKSIRQLAHKQLEYWSKRQGRFNLCAQLINAGAPEFAERVRVHLASLC